MKKVIKILSVFLAMLMIFTTVECVTPVFAEEVVLNDLEEEFDPEETVEFLAEEESFQTENSKTYLMSDGSFEYGLFSHRVNDSSNGPRRAANHNNNAYSVSATYITSTDGPDEDHSDDDNIILNSNSYGLVAIPTVGELNNYHIKTVNLYLPVISGAINTVVYAYYLDGVDLSSSVSFEDIHSHITCIDYAKITEYESDGKYISLDVTSAIRSTSGLVVLGCSDSVVLGKSISNSDDNDSLFMESGAPKVVLSYNYIITAGLDDDFEYTTFDIGKAGTAYINKQSGNLVVKRNDITTGTGDHSYSVSSIYNSMSTLGKGSWMKNFDASVALLGLLYVDENGTVSILYPEGEEENGVRKLQKNDYGFTTLEIIESQTTEHVLFPGTRFEHTISIPSATRYLLTADEGETRYTYTSEYNLTEIEVKDENGDFRTVMGKYPDPDDDTGNTYYIVDGDGNKIRVIKTETSITMTQILTGNRIGDTETITKDTQGNVISVQRNEQAVSAFTYDEENRMTSVTNEKGYRLAFEYGEGYTNDDGDVVPDYKVVSVQEFQGTTAGKKITYSRTYDSCTERTEGIDGIFNNDDDVITKYSFDNNCRLLCTQSETADGDELDSVSYSYTDNEFSGIASSGRISDNYLKNHNIESLANWTPTRLDDSSCEYSATYSTEESIIGNGSAKITVNDMTTTGGAGVYQAFTVSDSSILQRGEEYVVSSYIKTSGIQRDSDTGLSRNFGAAVMIRLGYNDGTSATRSYTEAVKDTNGNWERVFTWVNIPENCNKLTVYLLVRNGTGTAYFDGVQLEKGRVPSEYNLLENNAFDYAENTASNTGNSWIRKNLSTEDGISNGKFVVNGNVTAKKYFYQDVPVTEADQDNKYVLKVVAKGSSIPLSKSAFAVRLRTFYEDGTYSNSNSTTQFNAYNHEEQYLQVGYSIPASSAGSKAIKIRIYFMYFDNINQAEIETINFIESYDVYDFSDKTVEEKDDRGNVIRSVDEAGNVTTYTYNNNNIKLSETTVDSDGNTIYSATYNALGDIISEDDNGETTSYTYTDGKLSQTVFTDSNENVTTTDYINGVISAVQTKDKEDTVTYSASYDSYGCMTCETENGKTTTYTYNRDDFGNITSESSSDGTTATYTYSYFDDDNDGTDDRFEFVSSHSTDSDGVTRYYDKEDRLIREEESGEIISSYTYDDDGNLTSKTENGKTISYSYTDDKLTTVTRNGNSYNYTYDVWGNKESVKIGDQTLEAYSYKPSNGVLSQKTYGNGSTEKYSYNAYGQVSNVNAVGVGSYSFNYDSKGTLVYTRDNVGNFRTYYKYDKLGRSTGTHVVSTVNSNAYANDLYNTTISYNEDGKVSQNTISSVNNTIKNNYAYSTTEDGNEQAVSTFTSVRGVTSVYDDESRITTRTISTSTPYVQSYTYNDDGSVAEEISGNATFSYTYEDGRITKIQKNGELRQSYEYDDEGQLIRENNLDTNKTIVYTYDNGGNLDEKSEYSYTLVPTENLGAAANTVSYTYGDDSWNDKLTAFNGEAISYDAIGNPTGYRGATCTYFGRQLQTYSKGSTSISYKYDGNGLRTSKTVNGVQHDYYYVDDVLMYEKVGSDYELFYRYDNDGKLSMIVRYNFSNSTNYYYNIVTNTQGDVVKILSGSGAVAAEYTYDAWGNIVSIKNGSGTTITSSSNIGLQNSIRYRGYVYDNETGLYYLQSRYYDPEVGRFINCDSPDYIGLSDTPTGWNGFAYCENDPVNNSDPSGTISLDSLKNALKKVIDTLKKWVKIIISNIKKEVKSFLSAITYSNGVLKISVVAATLILDTVISACSKTSAAAMSAFGFGLNMAKKFAKQKMEDFFKKQMVPYLVRGYVNTFLTSVRKVFWTFVSKSTNVVLVYATEYTIDRIYKGFTIYKIVSLFSSWGSLLATMLDISDGNENDYIEIRRK